MGCYRFKEDEFEDIFIEFYLVNNYVPIASQLSQFGLPTTATIRRRYGMTFNEFLSKLGLPVIKKSTKKKSDLGMINDLIKLSKSLGRTPVTKDLVGRLDVRGKGEYIERFGSWSAAIKLAGLKPITCPVTDEELLEELKEFYKTKGRSPTVRDSLRYGTATISKRFGNWNNALIHAGLPINDSIFGVKTVGKDGKLYDSVSESLIADWLFENGISYDNHVPYFNKLIADFKVGDYYVEFFGLSRIKEYEIKMNLKRVLCKRKGYKLLEVLPEDLKCLDTKLEILKGGEA
jgi:hypothetical protein